MDHPYCQRCVIEGRAAKDWSIAPRLVPLSDYGEQGSNVHYKAWACTHPECGYAVRIDKGELTFGAHKPMDRPIEIRDRHEGGFRR